MTFFLKILQKLLFAVVLLFFVFSETSLYAQLSSEQQNQLNQYTTLVKDYKNQKKFRMVAYYLYKSGSVYLKAGEHSNAIDKFKESADYYEQIGSYSNKKKIYSNIAFVYAEMGQLKNAKKYYNKSLEISRRLNNRHDISASLMEVATIEIYIQDYAKAQTNLEEALKIGNSLNDALLLRTCYRLLAQLYKAYGNKKKSDQYYSNFLIYDKHVKDEGTLKREDIADKTISAVKEEKRVLIDEKEAQALLFELSDLKNKFEQDSLNRAISASADSLAKAEEITDLIRREKGLLEKENEYRKTNEKNLELENKAKDLQLYGAIVGIILLTILIIGAIVAFLQKREANKQLEQQKIEIEIKSDQVKNKNDELEDAMDQIQYQNKNIMQSINYAQRIQEAMMPKQKLMKSLLKESFIFFKPRDIVSGDFYWFMDTKPERNGAENSSNTDETSNVDKDTDQNRKFIVSAIDCTGHGVPGAFMSMLGHNLLNDIVGKGILESSKILAQLHRGIRTSLNQDATQNRDGMDIALCVIDPENKTMEYAGAQNPLIYIQGEKIFRVRGNKFPVGGFQVEHHDYTKHTININEPTTCYIFTDGYHDQFGGPQGRKFMTKNFRDLLYEIHNMPMEEQKNILELVINEWMGDNEQTDDILIIGFKLDFTEHKKIPKPVDNNVVAKELQTKKEKPLKEKISVKEIKKEDIVKVEYDLPIKEVQTENKKPVKEKIIVKEVQTENKKPVEEDIPAKELQTENKEPVKEDIPAKELQTESKKPVKELFTIRKLKTEKRKPGKEDIALKKLRTKNKPIKKSEEKAETSNNNEIKIRRL